MDYMCSIIKEYAAELEGPEFFTNFQTYEHILRCLKYLEKYKDYVLCLKKANRAALYNIFMHWIEDDMQEDITVIASIIYEHVKHHRFNDLPKL